MKTSKWLFVAVTALSIVACDARDRRMPNLEDGNAVGLAAKSLSPWKDGSPDRSRDGRSAGDYEGDRQTFLRWYNRWATYERIHQHDRDYQPFDVPSTMAAAVEQQHAFESDLKAKADAAQTERDAEQAETDADAEYYQQEADREQAAKDAAAAQGVAQQAEQDAALQVEQQAAKDAAHELEVAEAKQSRVNYECRLERQQAASAALNDKANAEPGMYQRVWDSFQCRSD